MKLGVWVVLFGSLSSTSCARPRLDESPEQTGHAGSAGSSATSPVCARDAQPAPAVSVARASPAVDCSPLEHPPRTERKDLPARGKYDSRASVLAILSSDALIDKEINDMISSDVAQKRRAFATHAEETIVETKGDPEPLTTERMGQEIKCALAGASPRLVSIECTNSRYFGGPYPGVDHFAYNFGLCAGKQPTALSLGALCKPDARCEKAILDLINGELSARKVDAKLDEHAEALRRFAITRTGLRFFANDDLPHAIQSSGTIDLAFARLRHVLRHDGPLGEWVGP